MILDTFSGSEFDVIVTAGGNPRFRSSVSSNTSSVHFINMVPSDKVIKMTDIAIHHGGQNTTVQCIENKVPSIIFPGKHFERYFNAINTFLSTKNRSTLCHLVEWLDVSYKAIK